MNFFQRDVTTTATQELLQRPSIRKTTTKIPDRNLLRHLRAEPAAIFTPRTTRIPGPSILRTLTLPARESDGLPGLLSSQANVPQAAVLQALSEQEETGVYFTELLERKGFITEKSLVELLVHHARIPYLNLREYVFDKKVLAVLPMDFCKKYRLLPVDTLRRSLTVAMVNPLDNDALKALTQLVPEKRIQRIICSNKDFNWVSERFFYDPVQIEHAFVLQ